MRPEKLPPITPEEMVRIWPDLWRDEDPPTIEFDATETAILPCGFGTIATADTNVSVETPQYSSEPVESPEAPAQSHRHRQPTKARHALRHFELGPFKIHRVVLPLAAVATGVAVAYFSPHGTPPANAERPQTSASPHPTKQSSAQPRSSNSPSVSPSDIPFKISSYDGSPTQSWSLQPSTGTWTPSETPTPSVAETKSQDPGNYPSHTPSVPEPTETTPSPHETPTPTVDPTTVGPSPSNPQPTETASTDGSGQVAPSDITPPQTSPDS